MHNIYIIVNIKLITISFTFTSYISEMVNLTLIFVGLSWSKSETKMHNALYLHSLNHYASRLGIFTSGLTMGRHKIVFFYRFYFSSKEFKQCVISKVD